MADECSRIDRIARLPQHRLRPAIDRRFVDQRMPVGQHAVHGDFFASMIDDNIALFDLRDRNFHFNAIHEQERLMFRDLQNVADRPAGAFRNPGLQQGCAAADPEDFQRGDGFSGHRGGNQAAA